LESNRSFLEEFPARLVFVDGVRRLEVRILVRLADGMRHGAFGSYGAGSVAVSEGAIEWGK